MRSTAFRCLILYLLLLAQPSFYANPSIASEATTEDNNSTENVLLPAKELTNKEIVDRIKASIKPVELKSTQSEGVVIRYELPKTELSSTLGDPKIQSKLNLVVSEKNITAEELLDIKNQAYKAALMGQAEAAIELYKKALAGEPSNPNTLFALGALYQRLKQYEEAKSMYKKVLAIEPEHAKAVNNYIVLMSEDAPLKALKELRELERINPNYSPVLAQIGMLYAKLDHYQEAEVYLRRAVSLSPETVNYRYNLAVLYDKVGAYDAAIKLYRQVAASYGHGETIPQSLDSINGRINHMQLMLSKKKTGLLEDKPKNSDTED